MNEIKQGRTYSSTVYGDNITELELTILDKAREIFGQDTVLEIQRDYPIIDTSKNHPSGKKFFAKITVTEMRS